MSGNMPYEFVLDYLLSSDVAVKPMFGHYAIHVNGKLVFFLIDKEDNPDNGICLATTPETIPLLEPDFPSLRPLEAYGPDGTDWRLIPVTADDFEESVIRACRLTEAGDPRFGRASKS